MQEMVKYVNIVRNGLRVGLKANKNKTKKNKSIDKRQGVDQRNEGRR